MWCVPVQIENLKWRSPDVQIENLNSRFYEKLSSERVLLIHDDLFLLFFYFYQILWAILSYLLQFCRPPRQSSTILRLCRQHRPSYYLEAPEQKNSESTQCFCNSCWSCMIQLYVWRVPLSLWSIWRLVRFHWGCYLPDSDGDARLTFKVKVSCANHTLEQALWWMCGLVICALWLIGYNILTSFCGEVKSTFFSIRMNGRKTMWRCNLLKIRQIGLCLVKKSPTWMKGVNLNTTGSRRKTVDASPNRR